MRGAAQRMAASIRRTRPCGQVKRKSTRRIRYHAQPISRENRAAACRWLSDRDITSAKAVALLAMAQEPLLPQRLRRQVTHQVDACLRLVGHLDQGETRLARRPDPRHRSDGRSDGHGAPRSPARRSRASSAFFVRDTRMPGCGRRHSVQGNVPAWRCLRSDRPPPATRYSTGCSIAQRLPMRPSAWRASGVECESEALVLRGQRCKIARDNADMVEASALTAGFRSPAASIPPVRPRHPSYHAATSGCARTASQ